MMGANSTAIVTIVAMVIALAAFSAVSNFAVPVFAAYGENSGENSASRDSGGDSGANVQQEGDFQGEN